MPKNDTEKVEASAPAKEKTVTVVVSDAKSLALPRTFDGVTKVLIKDGKAEVSAAVAEELKRNYPQLVTIV